VNDRDPTTNRAAIEPREVALCGLFGAAALLLPVVFHMVQLGKAFMPLYLPLVALGFFVRPAPAATTALVVPVVSALFTGMPPLFPPIAIVMAAELAFMAALISMVTRRWPRCHPLAVLVPVLGLGRVFYFGVMLVLASWLDLPAAFVAGLSLVSGWPGLILMVVVVPGLVLGARHRHPPNRSRAS
jgi:hypothetical protein